MDHWGAGPWVRCNVGVVTPILGSDATSGWSLLSWTLQPPAGLALAAPAHQQSPKGQSSQQGLQ